MASQQEIIDLSLERGLITERQHQLYSTAIDRGLTNPNPIGAAAQAQQDRDKLRGIEKESLEKAKLGEQFGEPTKIYDKDLNDPALRFKLSRIEKAQDAVRFLQKSGKLPEKSIAVALQDPETGSRIMGYMIPGEEGEANQFFRIDSPKEFNISDVADLGNLASIETVAAVGAGIAPAKTLVQRAIFEFVGAFTGKAVDEVIDQYSGLENQSVQEAGAEALTAGGINVLGGRVADAPIALANLARGRGFRTGTGDEITQAKQAALDAGVAEGLPPASIGGPLADRATEISERLGSGFLNRGVEGLSSSRRAAVASRLEQEGFERSDQGVLDLEIANLGDRGLLNLIDEAKNRARQQTGLDIAGEKPGGFAAFPFAERTKEEGGQALFRGAEEFAEKSKVATNKAYDDYLALAGQDGVIYDVSPLQQQAAELSRRYRLEGRETVSRRSFRESDINPEQVVTPTEVEVGPELTPVLRDTIRKIEQLKNIQSQNPEEAARALAQLRSTLIDEAEITPGAGTKTQSQAIASRLVRTLHEVITTPQGASGNVKQAFENANKLYKARASVLNALSFSRAKKDEIGSGERLFNSLTGDLTEEVAIAARRELPKEEFQNFQYAVITDLLNNPRSINTRLQNMGRGGEILVPKKIRSALDVYQRDLKNIDKGILAELFDKQASDARTVSSIIESGTAKELTELQAQGAIDKKDLQKLIFQNLLDTTTSFSENKLQVIPGSFVNAVEKLKNGRFWQLLSKEQREMLSNLETYTSFLKSADSGSSIAAAEIAAAQLQPLTAPKAALEARLKQIQIGMIANLANSDVMARAISGRGDAATPMTALRAAILLTAQSLNALESEYFGKSIRED